MFKGVEVGAWYRIRLEGKNVFGQVVERRGNRYTFQYLNEKGDVRTEQVARASIAGRLGDHLVASLKAAIVAEENRQAAESKVASAPTIAPGDWHGFQHQGKAVAGVVYRIEGDQCTIFFLYNGLPTFVTIDRSQIGPQKERLTAVFREEMAKKPNYLEEWVSAAGRFPSIPEPTSAKEEPGQTVQQRLFP